MNLSEQPINAYRCRLTLKVHASDFFRFKGLAKIAIDRVRDQNEARGTIDPFRKSATVRQTLFQLDCHRFNLSSELVANLRLILRHWCGFVHAHIGGFV